MAGSDAPPEKYIFYHYNPSLVAAIIFIVLFFVTTFLHAFQLVKRRTWYFIPFLIGGFFESIGYIGRALSSQQSPDWTLGPYIMQSLLLLLAPALFAASIYMVLGRIILLTDGESCSLIRAKWLTKIFVGGDVISFMAQSAGGGLMATAKSQSDSKRGENVITAGLGIQVGVFGFFVVVAGIFHYRIRKCPSSRSRSLTVPWERHLLVLYAASLLILIRSVFRIIEYVMGSGGVLLSNEVYLYIFDGTLMFLTMTLFNFWHPGNIISSKKDLHCHSLSLESHSSGYALENQSVDMRGK